MNYVNYFNHTISKPDLYHRRYDLDLESSFGDKVKRVALVALPFVSLYRPIGTTLSIGMGGCRMISHFNEALDAQDKKAWKRLAAKVVQFSFATFTLISTFFSFSIGLVITTGTDISQGVYRAAQKGWNREFQEAGEEILQALASSTYLAFMVTGALEAILLSTLVQATVCLYQARSEISKGRYLEAAGKIAFSGVRLYQANQYRQLIQRRNFIFSLQKYEALLKQAFKGKEVRHLIQSPLNDLNGKIDEKQVTLANQEQEFEFGSHFHGFGKGLVKGANITLQKEIVDGKEMVKLEFKVNHVFREKLEKTLNDFSKYKPKELKEILQLTGSHITAISDKTTSYETNEDELSIVRNIHLAGLGTITVGADTDTPNLYDRVTIRMDSNKTIYDLHELLAFTNLDETLCSSTPEDLDRLKMGHLFRTFFPKEASPFERSEEFFTLNLDALKQKMIEKAPDMKSVLDQYFHKISVTEILPGRIRYQIEGLADEIRKAGGVALTSVVLGAWGVEEELYARVASILKIGMISTEFRDSYGINKSGYSGSEYYAGSADSIFTQLVTKKDIELNRDLNDHYSGEARLLFSLDALESGSYQYYNDYGGNRRFNPMHWWANTYRDRANILEFTKKLQEDPVKPPDAWWWWQGDYSDHEVMLKERLDPSYITGLLLDSETTKQGLLNYLRKYDMIAKDSSGKETFHSIDIDKFFQVGTRATEALLDKKN